MPIIDLGQQERRKATAIASVAIVGAGAAGLTLAWRLAKAGVMVCLVESGVEQSHPDFEDLNRIVHWGSYSGATTGRFRGLGGTTPHWAGGLIPIRSHEIGPRPYLSVDGWPLSMADLEAHQPELDRFFGLSDSSYEEDLLETLDRKAVFPRGHPDFSVRWLKMLSLRKRNFRNIGQELAKRDNVQIWAGATVTGFELEPLDGRVSALEAVGFGDHSLTVRADLFVIAAGTIETTRLLLLLDRASENHAFVRCGVLGRYFQDHLDVSVGRLRPRDVAGTTRLFGTRFTAEGRRRMHLELTPEAQREDRVAGAFAHVESDVRSNLVVGTLAKLRRQAGFSFTLADVGALVGGSGEATRFAYWWLFERTVLLPQQTDLDLRICCEQLPNSNNRISLSNETDRLGVPRALLDWHPTQVEERTLRACVTRLKSYWKNTGIERMCAVEWHPEITDPDKRLIDKASDWFHPSGSTRMGTRASSSVVGPDLFCHDVPNLCVVSASTFPSAGVSNPTLTIMRLALRCAYTILEQLTYSGRHKSRHQMQIRL